MSFGQRENFEKRSDLRRRTLLRAELVFHEGNSVISGFVRNLSSGGAKFVVDYPVVVPNHVLLLFSSGDRVPCEVVRRFEDSEFGLRFSSAIEVDRIKAGSALSLIYTTARNISPTELHRLLRSVQFFGDSNLEQLMQQYLAIHNAVMSNLMAKLERRRTSDLNEGDRSQ